MHVYDIEHNKTLYIGVRYPAVTKELNTSHINGKIVSLYLDPFFAKENTSLCVYY